MNSGKVATRHFARAVVVEIIATAIPLGVFLGKFVDHFVNRALVLAASMLRFRSNTPSQNGCCGVSL